jgi:hypothetical protein
MKGLEHQRLEMSHQRFRCPKTEQCIDVLRSENCYSFTSQSMASSRVAKIGKSRCEKLLKFS